MVKTHTPDRRQPVGRPGLSWALSQKVYNAPLALSKDAAGTLVASIQARDFDPAMTLAQPEASRFVGARDARGGFFVTDDGLAIVPISGLLIDRGDWTGDLGGWLTTYEGIAKQLEMLTEQPSIKGVLLDIDSGGGMVAGLWDLDPLFAKLRKAKPVHAVANNFACSAAYAVGCMADEFFVTRSGTMGSIGVIVVHMSYARALDGLGIDPTIIAEGEHKTDGTVLQQLGHGARAEIAASVERAYDQFVAHVATHRAIDEDAVRATEARIYDGDLAVEAGLADGVKSRAEALKHLAKAVKARATAAKATGKPATDPKPKPPRAKEPAPIRGSAAPLQPDEAEMTTPNAAGALPGAATVTEASAQAAPHPTASDERARIQAITTSTAGCAAPKLAAHLAFSTDLSADVAAGILTAAGEDLAAAAEAPSAAEAAEADAAPLTNALAAEMAKPRNSAASVGPDGPDPEQAARASIPSLADRAKALTAPKPNGVRGR